MGKMTYFSKITFCLSASALVALSTLSAKGLPILDDKLFDNSRNFSRPPRTLLFPTDVSAGGVAIFPGQVRQAKRQNGVSVKAQAKIEVPANHTVAYFPNHNFFANPHILDAMAPDSLDNVVMRFGAATEKEEGLSNRALPYLNRFPSIFALDLCRSEIKDSSLSCLTNLRNVEVLELYANELDGSCFKDLTVMKDLKVIDLSDNCFKPENTKYFPLYPNLEYLQLRHLKLTAASLKPISKLQKLRFLGLSDNIDLGDEIIDDLLKLKSLRHLDIRGTKISASGLKRLQTTKIQYLEFSPSLKNPLSSGKMQKPTNIEPYERDIHRIFAPVSRDRRL
ncbi:MAG: hypothetical protein HY986_05370 [Candidatus Melainabacteria bacterium]|nr:hypothetical protein [Candidatus Melainabacteria bacterium]